MQGWLWQSSDVKLLPLKWEGESVRHRERKKGRERESRILCVQQWSRRLVVWPGFGARSGQGACATVNSCRWRLTDYTITCSSKSANTTGSWWPRGRLHRCHWVRLVSRRNTADRGPTWSTTDTKRGIQSRASSNSNNNRERPPWQDLWTRPSRSVWRGQAREVASTPRRAILYVTAGWSASANKEKVRYVYNLHFYLSPLVMSQQDAAADSAGSSVTWWRRYVRG